MESNPSGGQSEDIHPDSLKEQPPPFLNSFVSEIVVFISSNGWLLLGLAFLTYYIWTKAIKHRISSWQQQRQDQEWESQHYSDPEVVKKRNETMERARKKLQEEYDAMSARHAEKMKEKEAAKRLEKIAEWEKLEKGQGYRSKVRYEEPSTSASGGQSTQRKDASKRLKPEYNPLSGGGGACFRPPRRGGMGGG